MAISLNTVNNTANNHESRINSINTNISSLGTRITKLETNPPSSVAIVTINKSGSNTYPIPVEHRGKKFVIMTASVSCPGTYIREQSGGITNGVSISTWLRTDSNAMSSYGGGTINYVISGTNIVGNYVKNGYGAPSITHPSSIKVLFYK